MPVEKIDVVSPYSVFGCVVAAFLLAAIMAGGRFFYVDFQTSDDELGRFSLSVIHSFEKQSSEHIK